MIDEEKVCPECGATIPSDESICMNCGAEFTKSVKSLPKVNSKRSKETSTGKVIGGLIRDILIISVSVILILSLILGFANDKEANAKFVARITGKAYVSAGSNSGSSVNKNDVSSDLVQFLDQYEKFMDDYCSFMKKVNSGNYDMNQYTKLLNDLTEYENALAKLDTSKMSTADYAYYMEVITRVNNKLLNSMS